MHRAENISFDDNIRNRALNLLIDYSIATKKKMASICAEILIYNDATQSGASILLSRQDLEQWIKRNTVIGEAKLSLVVNFLKSDKVERVLGPIARNQLSNSDVRIKSTGRTIARCYPPVAPQFESYWPNRSALSDKTIDDYWQEQCGIFCGLNRHGISLILSVDRIRSEPFFIVHLLFSNSTNIETADDWNLYRMSGYGTFSEYIVLHLCETGEHYSTSRPTLHHCLAYHLVEFNNDRGRGVLLSSSNVIKELVVNNNFDVITTNSPGIKSFDVDNSNFTDVLYEIKDNNFYKDLFSSMRGDLP